MESKIYQAIAAPYPPVALLWSHDKPSGALSFRRNCWGCVMWLVAKAAKGRTVACDRQTFGCSGGGVGLGFGDQYQHFPGGEASFCRFLSTGNETSEEGRRVAEQVKPFMRPEAHRHFLHGERYLASPEKVREFLAALPITDIPAEYVVFKPLASVEPDREEPQVMIFFVSPDQLAALVVLANYGRGSCENVIIPFAAGCQSLGIYPYREALSPKPRAVVGLTDLSARTNIRRQLGENLMTFAVPWKMFLEMEANVAGSFLEGEVWLGLRDAGRRKAPRR